MTKELLLIVPAYNEFDSLPRVMAEIAALTDADALIVDDGSTDGTHALIRDRGWRCVRLPMNMGLSCAMETGMRYALDRGYRYAMQFDADGQHIAQYVPLMLAQAREKALDVVIGARRHRRRGMRGLGARLLALSIRAAAGKALQDPTSGMRLYSRRAMRAIIGSLNLRPEPDALAYLMLCGAHVGEYPVEMRPRERGKSRFGAMSSAKYLWEMAFSILILLPGRVRVQLAEEVET